MFKKVCVSFVVLVLVVLGTTALYAAPKVIKLAHLNAQTPFDVGTAAVAAVFKNELEARTGGV